MTKATTTKPKRPSFTRNNVAAISAAADRLREVAGQRAGHGLFKLDRRTAESLRRFIAFVDKAKAWDDARGAK